jgi:phage-related protein
MGAGRLVLGRPVMQCQGLMNSEVWIGVTATRIAVRSVARAARRSSGDLSGIDEIRIPDDGNAYRVYYLVEFKAAIYMLDAGIKKSPRGGEIPKQQVETLVERKKKAKEHYAKHKTELEKVMAERLPRRTLWQGKRKPSTP